MHLACIIEMKYETLSIEHHKLLVLRTKSEMTKHARKIHGNQEQPYDAVSRFETLQLFPFSKFLKTLMGYSSVKLFCLFSNVPRISESHRRNASFSRYLRMLIRFFRNEGSLITIRLVARPSLWLSGTLVYM